MCIYGFSSLSYCCLNEHQLLFFSVTLFIDAFVTSHPSSPIIFSFSSLISLILKPYWHFQHHESPDLVMMNLISNLHLSQRMVPFLSDSTVGSQGRAEGSLCVSVFHLMVSLLSVLTLSSSVTCSPSGTAGYLAIHCHYSRILTEFLVKVEVRRASFGDEFALVCAVHPLHVHHILPVLSTDGVWIMLCNRRDFADPVGNIFIT